MEPIAKGIEYKVETSHRTSRFVVVVGKDKYISKYFPGVLTTNQCEQSWKHQQHLFSKVKENVQANKNVPVEPKCAGTDDKSAGTVEASINSGPGRGIVSLHGSAGRGAA